LADVEVHLPAGTNPTSYLKYHSPNWIDFSANADITGDVVTLHLVDGGPGDSDGANGVIRDPGAPVVSPFEGFLAPVDNPPTRNAVKAGQAVPVRFSLDGDQGLDIMASGSPSSHKIDCDSGTPIDDIETTVTANTGGLTYDPNTNQYNYVWKTDKTWAKSCRELTIRLKDGSVFPAIFQLR
jgi:hypothetical protein